MIIVPKISYVGASKLYALMLLSYLKQIGFKIETKSFAAMSPSKDSLRRTIFSVGVDTLCILRTKIKDEQLFYACDGANKGGYHHMVKKMSWFDLKCNDLNVVVIDSDACIGTDLETAKALDFSFTKIDPLDGSKVIFRGQGTDAGGGGTSYGLSREMDELDRLCNMNDFF